jgi:hypothetical protein
MTVKTPSPMQKKKPNPECCEIEPNPSKDRALHERDNPSF